MKEYIIRNPYDDSAWVQRNEDSSFTVSLGEDVETFQKKEDAIKKWNDYCNGLGMTEKGFIEVLESFLESKKIENE